MPEDKFPDTLGGPDAEGSLPALSPSGKRLPDSPPIKRGGPKPKVEGRRAALRELDAFLKKNKGRLAKAFEDWLETDPRGFIRYCLIPLTPKEFINEGANVEHREATIQIVTNVPRPEGGPTRLTIEVGAEPQTIDVEGKEV